MKKIREVSGRRWGVVLLYFATIIVNYISQAIPFNGQTNGEVSDKYSTLITPADYAFSIWGLIYLTLGIYTLYQAFWASSEKRLYDQLAPWLMVAFVATSAWLPAFQYEMIALSVFIMLIILGSLIQLSIMITQDAELPRKEKAWARIPIGMYLGWISVATIVNISVLAKYGGWYLLEISEGNWLLIMIVVGFLLAVLVTWATNNLVYALVFVWAFVAIAVRHYDENTILQFAMGAAIVLLIIDLAFLLKQFRKGKVMAS
jgi:hypothetical protein